MTDKEIFNTVFSKVQERHSKVSMMGTIITYNGMDMFNIDGYNLGYNLYRLGKMLYDNGEFN